MGIKKQMQATQALPKHLTEMRNLKALLQDSVGREEPEALKRMIESNFRRADEEKRVVRIKRIGSDGQITEEQTEFYLTNQGASIAALRELGELADGEVTDDLSKVRQRCHSCLSFTTSELRDAETHQPLCRTCAVPHPFKKEAFVSPAVFELLSDDSWTRLEQRFDQWKARRMARKLQRAELQKQQRTMHNQGGEYE